MSLLVPGWVQRTMFGKYLSSEHLIASRRLGNRTTAFIKLDGSGGGTIVVVVLVLVLVLILIYRMMFAGYDALAWFPLAGDDGRIRRQYEGRWGVFGLFDFGR